MAHKAGSDQLIEPGPQFCKGLLYGLYRVYLDNGSSNFVVHHNVTWNIAASAIEINAPDTSMNTLPPP